MESWGLFSLSGDYVWSILCFRLSYEFPYKDPTEKPTRIRKQLKKKVDVEIGLGEGRRGGGTKARTCMLEYAIGNSSAVCRK